MTTSMSFHPPPTLMKLSNNLQPPLSPPTNYENNIYLCYKFMFELFDYYFMQWSKFLFTCWCCWWWSSENKWSPSRWRIASTIESRFCLDDWEALLVQTERFAGTVGRLGTLGLVLGTFCAFGTMRTSGLNLE